MPLLAPPTRSALPLPRGSICCVTSSRQVLEDGGDWRGRAQQISLLRDKLRELRARPPPPPVGGGAPSIPSGTLGAGTSSFGDTQGSSSERQARVLEGLEEKRRKGQVALAEDLTAAQVGGKVGK